MGNLGKRRMVLETREESRDEERVEEAWGHCRVPMKNISLVH